MAKNITVIPATLNIRTGAPMNAPTRRKVAGYARVSTDTEEQATSYEAQVDYYTHYIKSNPNWQFVKVYTDEGISALSTKNRDGFNHMIADALKGKIDLIVTKSVSRFARNTVDSLTTIRKLKERGCECYFEKENIYTFDGKGELLLTIMSSLAQEESRSISENVTWGHRKRFSDGKVTMPYKCFLGYKKGDDGLPHVVEKEANVVRLIYKLFLEGKTMLAICQFLEEQHIKSPSGKDRWHESTVTSILHNEKYKGDALLQKTYVADFLTKKVKVNEGEIPKYYVEHSHEAIIEPSEWQLVQDEFARRKSVTQHYCGLSVLSCKVFCGDCGNQYGPKVWHSNDKYRRIVWQCNNKFKDRCKTPALEENTIKEKFIDAYNELVKNKDAIMAGCEEVQEELTDCTLIDSQLNELNSEIDIVAESVKKCLNDNAMGTIDLETSVHRYDALSEKHDRLVKQIEKLTKEKERRKKKKSDIQLVIDDLSQNAPMEEWSDRPWIMLLDRATVYQNGEIEFAFKDGSKIRK